MLKCIQPDCENIEYKNWTLDIKNFFLKMGKTLLAIVNHRIYDRQNKQGMQISKTQENFHFISI